MNVKSSKTLFYRQCRPVIFQTLNDRWYAYCIQYGGGGRYFKTLQEVNEYLQKRFNIKQPAPINEEKIINQ